MGNIGCCSAANQTTNDTQYQNEQVKTTRKPRDFSAPPESSKDDLIDSYRGANPSKHSRNLSKRQDDNGGQESDESDLSTKYGNLHAPEKVPPNKQFVRQLSKNMGNLRVSSSKLDAQPLKNKMLSQKQQQIEQYNQQQAKMQQDRLQVGDSSDSSKQKSSRQRTNENMSVEFQRELDKQQPLKESDVQSPSPKKVQEEEQEEESTQRDQVLKKPIQRASKNEPRRQQTQNMQASGLNNDEDSESYNPEDSLDNSKAKNSERYDDLESEQVYLRSQTQQEQVTNSSHRQSNLPFQRQRLKKKIASEISSSIQESQRLMEQQDEVADLENSFDQDYYEEESSNTYDRSNTDYQQLKKSRNLMGNDSIQFDDEISEIGGEGSMTQSKKKKKKKKKKKGILGQDTQVFDNSRDSSKLSSTNRPKTRKVKVLQL